ncbi:MAG: hypothetical protein WC557_08365 [Ignavibacteriaceae bacterium]
MGIKPIPRKKFVKFLKSIGLKFIRSESSHDLYDYPESEKKLLRPVTVDTNYNDVVLLHIHTNLQTLGMSKKEFLEKLKGV